MNESLRQRNQRVCSIGHELLIVGKHLFETTQPDGALLTGATRLRELASRLEEEAALRMVNDG